jgi:preprotein translocase subunit SecD
MEHIDTVDIPEVYVALTFTSNGKELFSKATEENIGKRILIKLDDTVLSAPIVNEKISSDEVQITGDFTLDEAVNLSDLIRAGALPFDLIFVAINE